MMPILISIITQHAMMTLLADVISQWHTAPSASTHGFHAARHYRQEARMCHAVAHFLR